MYKSKLQDMCHSKSWNLPEYTITKNGPDHYSNFGASITVNGILFQTQAPLKSAKMAQNDVAKLALDYFSTVPFQLTTPQPTIPTTLLAPSQPLIPVPPQEPSLPLQQQHQETSCVNLFPQPVMPTQASHQPLIICPLEPKGMYKQQLQQYAQKNNLKFPVYSCDREGPSHASRFKCNATIDGKTYVSIDSFSTIKDAENDVARIALVSLSQFGAQELIEDDSILYKNLLQELAQKKKLNLPIYSTEKFGESHIPKFISTVEFEGETFTGQASKTRKQAEMSAAEVAYHAMRKQPEGMYKQELQQYAQKNNLKFLVNSCEHEEPSHASRFKCNATIDGKTCMRVDSFSTIKDADNDVTKIALASISQFGAQEIIQDDYILYKNLLQELAQKKKSSLPIYRTEIFGESHIPKFISTVEFEGETFTGQASKTKKQAEMSAADVAYHAVRNESVHNLQLNMTNEPQKSVKPNATLDLNPCLSTAKQGLDGSWAGDGGSNLNSGSIQNALISSSTVPLCHLSSTGEGTPSKRICIYPRTPNMTYPEGSVVLPMSDDKWVALCLSGNQNYSANA